MCWRWQDSSQGIWSEFVKAVDGVEICPLCEKRHAVGGTRGFRVEASPGRIYPAPGSALFHALISRISPPLIFTRRDNLRLVATSMETHAPSNAIRVVAVKVQICPNLPASELSWRSRTYERTNAHVEETRPPDLPLDRSSWVSPPLSPSLEICFGSVPKISKGNNLF